MVGPGSISIAAAAELSQRNVQESMLHGAVKAKACATLGASGKCPASYAGFASLATVFVRVRA